jgi:trans-2,3-dihydro-3-hydroxyanthranilate isomerase
MQLPFVQLDVFTERALGGNPLAIFPQPAGLTGEQMQALARETNLSETTFITGRDNESKTYKVRIFTPAQEVPFAGHPTIGTAWYIFRELGDDTGLITLDLAGGRVRVWREGLVRPFVYFEPPRAELCNCVSHVSDLCRLVNLHTEDLALELAPAQVVKNGLNFIMIPLRNREALEAAQCDIVALRQMGSMYGFNLVTVFCMEGYKETSLVSTRMFAPLHGIPEDPATGSSAAGLTAYLRHHNVIEDCGDNWITIDQGYSLKRPSLIYARANAAGDGEIEVKIGGHTVEIASGNYLLGENAVGGAAGE